MKLKLILCLILFSPVAVWATDYYVTQSGAGGQDGLAIGTAWSVSDFNSSANWDSSENAAKIDPGDTVYFSGTLTDPVVLPSGKSGLSGKEIILDGWQGGTCNPVADHDAVTYGGDPGGAGPWPDHTTDLSGCDDAAIIDLDSISNAAAGRAFVINGSDYIIVQDFQIRDAGRGFAVWDASYITIRRNYVHDIYYSCFANTLTAGEYVTVGGLDPADGNFFYNCGEILRHDPSGSAVAGMTKTAGDDIIFSYNEIGNDYQYESRSYSNNSLEVHGGDRQLIQYNHVYRPQSDAAISVKENGGTDKIVRFNKIHAAGFGISISTSSGGNDGVYCYGNFVYDIEYQSAIRAYKKYSDIHIWSNIISVADEKGLAVWYQESDTQGDVFVYNNTIYMSGQDDEGETDRDDLAGFYTNKNSTDTLDLSFVNNILMNNDARSGEKQAVYNSNVTDAYISAWADNLYYNSGGNVSIYFDGVDYASFSAFQSGESWGTGGAEDNPDFTDANGADNTNGTEDDDFTLTAVSPAVGTGTDLSQCFNVSIQGTNYNICYDDGLDPVNTDWTARPIEVATLSQDDYGSWEKGAYVFTEASPIRGVSIQ